MYSNNLSAGAVERISLIGGQLTTGQPIPDAYFGITSNTWRAQLQQPADCPGNHRLFLGKHEPIWHAQLQATCSFSRGLLTKMVA